MREKGRTKTRAIVVHDLDQAEAALRAAAAAGRPVVLASAPGAAGFGGGAWFLALIEHARSAVPDARFEAVLDCSDQAGWALAALRQGCPMVRFTGPRRTAVKLAQIAEQQGAQLLTGPLKALDLLDESEPEAACQAWLGLDEG